MPMFEYTESTVSSTGVVKGSYHSEPEYGTAEAFLDNVYANAQKKPFTTVVQSGTAVMIVTPEGSTLVQAEDLTPSTEEGKLRA